MNKKDVKNAIDLEEYYNKVRKIRFDTDIEIKSLEDIYNNLFGRYGGNHEAKQKNTYYKKGTTQCISGSRYRSFDDFFNLCKSYFPEMTLKEMSSFLIDKEETLLKDNKKLCVNYCYVIRKYNIWGAGPYANGDIKSIKELPFNKEFININVKLEDLIT